MDCFNFTLNIQRKSVSDTSHKFIIDDVVLPSNCSSIVTSTETSESGDVADFNALVYIVVVIMFYALSMTLLMVKYIKREREEAELDFFFNEFVKRERFNNSTQRNERSTAKTNIIARILQRPQPCATSGSPVDNREFEV